MDETSKKTFTGSDIFYREGAVGLHDVQRAADALLRQGRKPSVAAIREHLGGGSPNTITPLLAKYWEKLGRRLGDGPELLERVPEALVRVTELLWRRALEEARTGLKILQQPDHEPGVVEELQEQISRLSVALAEARAREGEQMAHLATLSREREGLRIERARLMALLKSTQALLAQQTARTAALEDKRKTQPRSPKMHTSSVQTRGSSTGRHQPRRVPARNIAPVPNRRKARKSK